MGPFAERRWAALPALLSLLVMVGGTAAVHAACTSLYGKNPCRFVPAPPGQTPACARPGLTYCEHPDHYPGQLIYHLVKKWQVDHQTLLRDESKEDFAAYFTPPPRPVYGPPPPPQYGPPPTATGAPPHAHGHGHHHEMQGDGYQPEPIYIPKPDFPASYQETGLTYIPPKLDAHNFSLGFSGYSSGEPGGFQDPSSQFYNYKYTSNIPSRPAYQQPSSFNYNPQSYYQPSPAHLHGNYYGNINEIWKGNERLKRSLRLDRLRRSLRPPPPPPSDRDRRFANGTASAATGRSRRQAAGETQPLCRFRSQFIMPRAALSNKGNWMYIVNMPEVNDKYTQLVKSETCIDQTCSGLCSVPDGYTARCEQKYVQKRLVALDGGGTNLYSEIFWFPSCCVCTVVRN